MQAEIKTIIQEALKNLDIEDVDFVVEHPADLAMGDYSTNVAMVCAKKLKTNPKDLAEKITTELSKTPFDKIEKIESIGGFINFYLKREFFALSVEEIIKKYNFGQNNIYSGQKFFIEHTQPNPFKGFHIGHLMNNTIGEALVRLVRSCGGEVKAVTYHGDKGLHVAKAIWGFSQQKDWSTSYAYGNKAYDEDEEAKAEIIAINKKVYDGSDEEINKIYKEGTEKSFAEFEAMYARLGSVFSEHFLESEAGNVGKKIVLENVGQVFEEGDGGAIVFKGEKYGLHTRVFLNSEGLPTYEAKEVGLAKIKISKYKYDQSITITGNEQDDFFKVTESAIGEVFPELKGKLKHLSHGMLRLPTGKMSSRTGDVIIAESLIDLVKEKTKGEEGVAIGAIKYMILRQSIGGDIVFDLDKSVSTEGDSGVYLQYSHARARSILEKAKTLGIEPDFSKLPEEIFEVEKLLYRFGDVILYSALEYEPHHLVNYLTELARAFNSFYGNNLILDKEDNTSPYKVAISSAFTRVMKTGLNLLGIEAPEKM